MINKISFIQFIDEQDYRYQFLTGFSKSLVTSKICIKSLIDVLAKRIVMEIKTKITIIMDFDWFTGIHCVKPLLNPIPFFTNREKENNESRLTIKKLDGLMKTRF